MSRNERDYFILRNGHFFLWSLAREQIFAVRDELGCHATKETILFCGMAIFLWSLAREQIFAVRDELGCHATKETILFCGMAIFLWSLAREQIFAVRDELGCHVTKATIYFTDCDFFCGHWRGNKFLRFEMSWKLIFAVLSSNSREAANLIFNFYCTVC